MAKATPTPSGMWRLRVYVGTDPEGKNIYKSFTCKSEAACYRAERTWMSTGGKTAMLEEIAGQTGPTVGDALEAYVNKCAASTARRYSPATIVGYRAAQRALAPYHGIYVEDLTEDDIQDIIDLRSATVGYKTIVNELYLLKPALRLAGRKDLQFDELELPEHERIDYVIPTDADVQLLLTHLEDDPRMSAAVVMGAFLGMRRSEIAGARCGDLDPAAGTLRVERAVVLDTENRYVEKATKTLAGRRTIDVSPEVMAVLRRRFVQEGRVPAAGESITGLSPAQISTRFRGCQRALGFAYTFHGLRHYHASTMLALGVPQKYIINALGHADFAMVQRVYGQIVKDKEKAVSDVIGAHSDTILRGEHYDWNGSLTSRSGDVTQNVTHIKKRQK